MSAEPVAVVGLGCVLPDAFDVASFWERSRRGVSSVKPLAGETWQWSRYLDATGRDPDRALSAIGAQVLGWRFDWRKFRVPPADAAAVNVLQWMVLDAGAQALSHVKRLPKETTGLFLGATGLGWQRDTGLRIHLGEAVDAIRASAAFRALSPTMQQRVIDGVKRELDLRLKPVSDDNVVGAAASVAAGRIAMHFDLHGLHYAVDAGFASALAAVDVGVRSLRDRTLDAVVVGGVSELITPLELVAFSRLGGIAKTHVAPFCATAEGTLLGEGTALFVLKRLDDALRDGETIHAVIRGVGASSDGKGKSVMAPRHEGQALAMKRAYDDASVDPASLAFVECHATGTPVGDVSEVQALSHVVASSSTARKVWLGSAKAQVGHLRAGAGAVALLRATLAVRERVMPKQIGVERPNPLLELERTPFALPLEEQQLASSSSSPITAGVSAFGFGGNNVHCVIESAPIARSFVSVPAPPPAPVASSASTIPLPANKAIANDAIAIVGMGGLFPTGATIESFWQSLLDGKDATTTIPADRFSVERYCDPDPTRLDTSYSKLGCFLDELPKPTPKMGIPPSAFQNLDPSQTLTVLAAEQALANVQLDDKKRVAVMLAFLPYQGVKFSADTRVMWREYEHELLRELQQAGVDDDTRHAIAREAEAVFKRALPPITEDSLPGWLGALCAARVTREWDLHGPHFVVDSACASTHAAVHAAVTALRHRTADVALAGGVWCDMRPEFFVAACRFNALSATGEKPFDKNADGFIPGEGAGVFALMRLDDALQKKMNVVAVIKSVCGSSDGRGRSVLAPTVDGEALAMKRALDGAGVSADDVAYVECHGTGTALGDVVEVEALQRAYGDRKSALLIGSVKSNVGHLNAAAGVPALAKVAMALSTGTLPASLKCAEPNPSVDWSKGPVRVVTSTTTLPAANGKRVCAVSGFGVGGSNMHLIVEEAPAAPASRSTIVVVGGADVKSCTRALREKRASAGGPVRVAIVDDGDASRARQIALLESNAPAHALKAAGVFVADASTSGRVAFCFPGQGAQYPGMASQLAAHFPEVKRTFAEVDAAYARIAGRALTSSFHAQLADEDAHCAVFAVAVAVARLLQAHGVKADCVLGQSAGEIAALVVANALSLEDGLRLLFERTRSVLSIATSDRGQMVSLRCGADRARALLRSVPGFLVVSADNCAHACLVSGETAACVALVDVAVGAGVEASLLPVSHAYHSSMIAAAQPRFAQALESVSWSSPSLPLYSSVTGDALTSTDAIERALLSQLVEPVRLQQTVRAAWRDGVRVFVECGPKWPLSTFIDDILANQPHVALPTLHPKTGEVEQLQRALAGIAAHTPSRATASAPTRTEAMTSVTTTNTATEADPMRKLLTRIRDAIDAYLVETATDAASTATNPIAALAPLLQSLPSTPKSPTTTPAPAPAPAVAPIGKPPVAATPAPTTAATIAIGRGRDPVVEAMRMLIEQVVARTGYPAEMLEPDLDLEADLGIDTVKQVAVVAEVKAKLGLPRDPSFKLREHNTLKKVAHYIARQIALHVAPPAASTTTTTTTPTAAAMATRTSTPPKRATTGFDDVKRALLEIAVARTGYPAEMLELDLDLEADLGIDTVKQVAIVAELKQRFSLQRDPQFKLRDHNTMRKVIEHIIAKTGTTDDAVEPAPAPTPPALAPILATPSAATTAATTATIAALEIERSAQVLRAKPMPIASAAVTWKSVLDVPGEAHHPAALVERLIDAARRAGHIGRLAAIDRLRVTATSAALVVEAADETRGLLLRAREVGASAPAVVVAEGSLRLEHGLPANAALSAAREIVAAAQASRALDAGRAPFLAALLAEVASWPSSMELADVDVPAFDEIVVHARFTPSQTQGTDAHAAASLVAAGAAALGVGAAALLGEACALGGVEAARLMRVPRAGERLAFVAHAHGPRAGKPSGDVAVVDDSGAVVASLQGLWLASNSAPLSRETWARVRSLQGAR